MPSPSFALIKRVLNNKLHSFISHKRQQQQKHTYTKNGCFNESAAESTRYVKKKSNEKIPIAKHFYVCVKLYNLCAIYCT